jgi:hypothetical protein
MLSVKRIERADMMAMEVMGAHSQYEEAQADLSLAQITGAKT